MKDRAAPKTQSPRVLPGPGACDTHIHFFTADAPRADTARKPLPPPVGPSDYAALQSRLGLTRAVLVQPTHYGTDNSVQLDAMAQMGTAARMVATIAPETSTKTLEALHRRGVRGARFFLLEGGAVAAKELIHVAHQIAPLGWHVEVQINGSDLPDLAPTLCALPCPVVIAHIGRFTPPVPVCDPAFQCLLRLVAEGLWVKISAPYVNSRSGTPAYADVAAQARALIAQNPDRMLWASNWPHTNNAVAPDEAHLLDLLHSWCDDDTDRYQAILSANPARLYGFV